jgi:hypothetical protein
MFQTLSLQNKLQRNLNHLIHLVIHNHRNLIVPNLTQREDSFSSNDMPVLKNLRLNQFLLKISSAVQHQRVSYTALLFTEVSKIYFKLNIQIFFRITVFAAIEIMFGWVS